MTPADIQRGLEICGRAERGEAFAAFALENLEACLTLLLSQSAEIERLRGIERAFCESNERRER